MNEPRFTMIVFDTPDRDGHRFRAINRNGISTEVMMPARNWCRAEFGEITLHEETDNYRGSRWAGYSSFWFRDEADALAFKMRWC